MLSLDYIRRKIRSIETISKITNAMYLVATASLRKCFKQFNNSQVFFNEFYDAISNLLDEKDQLVSKMFNPSGPTYYVAIGGDIGLCGSYNSGIFKLLTKRLCKGDRVCLIGKKCMYLFKSNNLIEHIDELITFPPGGINIYFSMYLADLVLKKMQCNFSKIVLVYTKYRNAILLEPILLPILPLDAKLFKKKKNKNETVEYEPSKHEILQNIAPMIFSIFLYGALSESRLCENLSRRNSMHTATKNADNLVKKYKLIYNKVRQNKITQEIIEVVTGSSASERSS